MKAISILCRSLWQVRNSTKVKCGNLPPCADCLVFLNCKTENGKILPFLENGKAVHWEKFPERLLGMNKHWSAGGELSGYQLFIHVQILCATCTPLGTTISKPGFLFVIYDKKKSKLNVEITKFLDFYNRETYLPWQRTSKVTKLRRGK